jgi:hypothetical protein
VKPSELCRKHLLGEHRELHAIWSVIANGKKGYSKHPETLRWVGKLKALQNRHEALTKEMEKRNYKHFSPLDEKQATGSDKQTEFVNSIEEQIEILKNKECACFK